MRAIRMHIQGKSVAFLLPINFCEKVAPRLPLRAARDVSDPMVEEKERKS